MCDFATQQILETIVRQKTAKSEMFTTLDITREAQAEHKVQHRHNYMKNDVHRIYNDGMMIGTDKSGHPEPYTRSLIELDGVPVKVWLYHTPSSDITTYQSKYLTPKPPTKNGSTGQTVTVVQPPAKQTKTARNISNNGVSGKVAASTDKRGRLWIPRAFLRNIGLKPGQWTIVTIAPNDPVKAIYVSPDKSAPTGHSDVANYKVDRKGNVAISASCFTDAGMQSSNFDVVYSSQDNRISVLMPGMTTSAAVAAPVTTTAPVQNTVTQTPVLKKDFNVYNKVVEIVSSQMGVPESSITNETLLVADLNADELDIVEIIMEIEDEYSFSIGDDADDKFQGFAIKDLVDFIINHKS